MTIGGDDDRWDQYHHHDASPHQHREAPHHGAHHGHHTYSDSHEPYYIRDAKRHEVVYDEPVEVYDVHYHDLGHGDYEEGDRRHGYGYEEGDDDRWTWRHEGEGPRYDEDGPRYDEAG